MTTKTIKMPRSSKTETDIAVLQVQVKNIDDKVNDLKMDLKAVNECLDKNNAEMRELMKGMQDSAENAHSALSKKISALEKWRWMMMGAGIVIGSIGFDSLSKLLK